MFVVACAVRGLCDNLIPRSGVSYRVCVCLIVCDLEISTMRQPNPELDAWATAAKKKNKKNKKTRVLENSSAIIWDFSEIPLCDFSTVPKQQPCFLISSFLNNFVTITVENIDISRTPSISAFNSYIRENPFISFLCFCSSYTYLETGNLIDYPINPLKHEVEKCWE